MVRNPFHILFQVPFLTPWRQGDIFRPPLSSGGAWLYGHQGVWGSTLPEGEVTWRDLTMPSLFPPVSVRAVLNGEQHLCPSSPCQVTAVAEKLQVLCGCLCILWPIWPYFLTSGAGWRGRTITISHDLAASLVMILAFGVGVTLIAHSFLDQHCARGSSHQLSVLLSSVSSLFFYFLYSVKYWNCEDSKLNFAFFQHLKNLLSLRFYNWDDELPREGYETFI